MSDSDGTHVTVLQQHEGKLCNEPTTFTLSPSCDLDVRCERSPSHDLAKTWHEVTISAWGDGREIVVRWAPQPLP